MDPHAHLLLGREGREPPEPIRVKGREQADLPADIRPSHRSDGISHQYGGFAPPALLGARVANPAAPAARGLSPHRGHHAVTPRAHSVVPGRPPLASGRRRWELAAAAAAPWLASAAASLGRRGREPPEPLQIQARGLPDLRNRSRYWCDGFARPALREAHVADAPAPVCLRAPPKRSQHPVALPALSPLPGRPPRGSGGRRRRDTADCPSGLPRPLPLAHRRCPRGGQCTNGYPVLISTADRNQIGLPWMSRSSHQNNMPPPRTSIPSTRCGRDVHKARIAGRGRRLIASKPIRMAARARDTRVPTGIRRDSVYRWRSGPALLRLREQRL